MKNKILITALLNPSNNAESLYNPNLSTNSTNFPQNHNRRVGFNDLERRQQDLCRLVNNPCSGTGLPSMINILENLTFIPLPEHGH